MGRAASIPQQLTHANAAMALLVLGIPGTVFWPYFSGAALLMIGLSIIIKSELPHAHGLDKLLPFGRLFYTIPMAVFGAEHFTSTRFIMRIVPSWIPAHRFWVYLVGTALLAAAICITVKRMAALAALLLGIMLFLFVLLMHIPNVVANPGNRILWVVALRDTAFSGGAIAFAGAHMKGWCASSRQVLMTIARFFIAVPAVFFSVEHFLHPGFVPGVPLEKITASWVPARFFWAYLAGAVLFAAGASIMMKKQARLAATCLGMMILLLVLFVYMPTLVSHPSDIAKELNYVVDTLAFSGAAFLLADALPKVEHPQEREEAI
jgi:uncharacterized membrane protein